MPASPLTELKRVENQNHLVFLHRATEGFVEVEVADDLGWRRQASGLQLVGKVIPLQALVCEREERGVGEPVAAVARDEVDADTAGRQVG